MLETPSLWPHTVSTKVGVTHPAHLFIFPADTTLSQA